MKLIPRFVATFRTEIEALAYARGIEEGLDFRLSDKRTDRTIYTFGLLVSRFLRTGEWRSEIELHD